jgi:hypothetical protein
MFATTKRPVVALSLLSLMALAFVSGLTSCDKGTLTKETSPLKVRGRQGVITNPDLLVRHLQERSKGLLDCANRNLPGRNSAERSVLHFRTRFCDGTLQDAGTDLRESREVQEFAECALAVLREDFPAAEFVNGSPCSHDFLREPDLLRRAGGDPGEYEIIVPQDSCRFEQVEVVPDLTPEELRLMVERAESPQPRFSIGKPILSESCDRDDIEEVVRLERSNLRSCYETDVQRKPGFRSDLWASFDVDDGGKVARVEINGTLGDEEIGDCVKRVLRKPRFDAQQDECHVKLVLEFLAGSRE